MAIFEMGYGISAYPFSVSVYLYPQVNGRQQIYFEEQISKILTYLKAMRIKAVKY